MSETKFYRPLTDEEKQRLRLQFAGLPAPKNIMAAGVDNHGYSPTDLAVLNLERMECLQATIERLEYELVQAERRIDALQADLDHKDAEILAMVDEVLDAREIDGEEDGALISLTDLGWEVAVTPPPVFDLEYIDLEEEAAMQADIERDEQAMIDFYRTQVW